jgi:hypothetical protein
MDSNHISHAGHRYAEPRAKSLRSAARLVPRPDHTIRVGAFPNRKQYKRSTIREARAKALEAQIS